MRISERVDNAVRAMADLAVGEGHPTKAEAIAQRHDISLKYLLDILRDLKRGELVRSKRGPDGGFSLSRPADQITLADIFRAIDGPLADVHDESLPRAALRRTGDRAAAGLDGDPRQPAAGARDGDHRRSRRGATPAGRGRPRCRIPTRHGVPTPMTDPSTTIASATIDAAVRAVQRASSLTASAQGRLLAGDTLTKGDDSPVTVADFAAQAVVCATLHDEMPDLRLVGEEDATDLTGPDQAPMLDGVADLVAQAMARNVASRRGARLDLARLRADDR